MKAELLPRIFFNFRIDRPRQLTKAFVMDNFVSEANLDDFDPYSVKYHKKHIVELSNLQKPFARGPKLSHLYFVTMTEYSQSVKVSAVSYPPNIIPHPMGEEISNSGLTQLRMSESEKERFVTYYFNGLRETPFEGEDRLIIPSPKVSTYDLKPEMSSRELTSQLINNIKSNKYNFILVNFACPDMVAHTGNLSATIKACEAIDISLSQIVPEVIKLNGVIFITADHGNAEELINMETGGIDTEHSSFPVPLLVISKKLEGKAVELPTGVISDIAPVILNILHITKPKEMGSGNLLTDVLD